MSDYGKELKYFRVEKETGITSARGKKAPQTWHSTFFSFLFFFFLTKVRMYQTTRKPHLAAERLKVD